MVRSAIVAALALAACTDPTQLVVVVDTDMGPGELDGFRVRVTGPVRVIERPVAGDEPFAVFRDGGVELPATFGVAPKGDADHTVEVSIAAIRDGREGQPDIELFRTRAITGFIEHRMLRLDLFLARRCVTLASDCRDDETCTEDGCVRPERPADSLPGWNGTLPPRRDAGPPPDAGTPTDARAPTDASSSTDATVPLDATVLLDAAIDAGPGPTTPFFALVAESADAIYWVWVDGVAADEAGRVFVAGRYAGDVMVQGVLARTDRLSSAPFFAAWDAAGVPLWVKTPPQSDEFYATSTALGFDPVTPALVLAVDYDGAQLVIDDVPMGSDQNRNIAVAQIDPEDGGLLHHADILGGTLYLEGLAVSDAGQVALVANLSGHADAYDLAGAFSDEDSLSWSLLLATWGPGLTGVWTRVIHGTAESGAVGVAWTEPDRLVVGGTFQSGLDWPDFTGVAPGNGGGFLLGFGADCGTDWLVPTILEPQSLRPDPVAVGQPRDAVVAVFGSKSGDVTVDGALFDLADRPSVLAVQRTPAGESAGEAALWQEPIISAVSGSPWGELLAATESGADAPGVYGVDGSLVEVWSDVAPGAVLALAGTPSGLVVAAGRVVGEAVREGVSIGANDARPRAYLWVFQPQ